MALADKCATCGHTERWHAKPLTEGGHETAYSWCSCKQFTPRKARVRKP